MCSTAKAYSRGPLSEKQCVFQHPISPGVLLGLMALFTCLRIVIRVTKSDTSKQGTQHAHRPDASIAMAKFSIFSIFFASPLNCISWTNSWRKHLFYNLYVNSLNAHIIDRQNEYDRIRACILLIAIKKYVWIKQHLLTGGHLQSHHACTHLRHPALVPLGVLDCNGHCSGVPVLTVHPDGWHADMQQ